MDVCNNSDVNEQIESVTMTISFMFLSFTVRRRALAASLFDKDQHCSTLHGIIFAGMYHTLK